MDKLDLQEKIWGFIFGIIAIIAACLEVVVNGISAATILGAIKDIFGTAVVVVVFIAIIKDKFPKKQKSFEERLELALDNWREENSNMIIRNPKYDEEHIGQGASCYSLDLKTEVSDFYRPMGITKNTGLFLRMPVINKENYNNGNVKIRFYLNKGTFFSDQPKDTELKSKYAYLIDLFTKLINEKHAGFACANGKGQEISVLIKQPIESDTDIETMVDVINTMYTAYLVSANLGNNMRIFIHRGQNQIGGSIVEVATEKTRIVFDVGINLDETEIVDVPKIDGLFSTSKLCDAVFISHYHSDHIGLLDFVVPNIPIFMGEKAYNVFKSASEYRRKSSSFKPKFVYDKTAITVGDITITPFLCDHSAFDAYMFLIEADEKKVLYTGDFRANGRLNFNKLLSELPKVDALIIEGTTLTRENNTINIEEEFLEELAIKELKKHKGPAFIMMSAMNIDRLITAYNAANATGRIFLEDIYTAEIANSVEANIPKPNGSNPARVFLTVGGDENYKKLQKFGKAKIGKEQIAKTPFLMCVRSSMINYLKRLNELCSFEDGVLFYGMWKGYMEQESTKVFIEFMKSKGVKLHMLHTSGHADEQTIERLISTVSPKSIIPVHTENANWFDKYTEIRIIKECNKIIV